jgi:hypothetical protein
MPHAAACPSTKEPCTVYELHSDITSKSTTASGATNGWAILCSPLGPARGEPIRETLLHATLHTTASQEQDIRTSSVCKLLLKLLAGLRKRAPGEDRSAPPSTVGRMPTLANTRPRVHFTQTDGRAGSVVPLDGYRKPTTGTAPTRSGSVSSGIRSLDGQHRHVPRLGQHAVRPGGHIYHM